ncbi:hypothetical protein B0H11DRAFT_1941960 [Mycena galericulata]|nr:hypothetical protein B0H11DRAFT_1941960 [Mycena galericulata]
MPQAEAEATIHRPIDKKQKSETCRFKQNIYSVIEKRDSEKLTALRMEGNFLAGGGNRGTTRSDVGTRSLNAQQEAGVKIQGVKDKRRGNSSGDTPDLRHRTSESIEYAWTTCSALNLTPIYAKISVSEGTTAPFVDEAGVAGLATRVIMENLAIGIGTSVRLGLVLEIKVCASISGCGSSPRRPPFQPATFFRQSLISTSEYGCATGAVEAAGAKDNYTFRILLISFEHVERGLRNLKSNRERGAEAARTGMWVVHVIEDATSLRGGVPLRVVP